MLRAQQVLRRAGNVVLPYELQRKLHFLKSSDESCLHANILLRKAKLGTLYALHAMHYLVSAQYHQIFRPWCVRSLNFKRGPILLKRKRRVNLLVLLKILLRRNSYVVFKVQLLRYSLLIARQLETVRKQLSALSFDVPAKLQLSRKIIEIKQMHVSQIA